MKATIEFNLPEDNCDHIVAVHAMDFALVCYDIDNALREWLKYGHEFKTVDDAVETMREKLSDFLATRNVSLDMIE